MQKGFKGLWAWGVCGLLLLVARNDALAAPPAAVEKPVAVVLKREIPRSALRPRESERQARRATLSPEDYALWESNSEMQALQELLLGPLLQAYIERKGLVPAKQDIEAAVAGLSSGTKALRQQLEAERDRLRAELGRVDLSPEQRRSLQASQESTERALRGQSEDDAALGAAALKELEDEVAREMVLSWMVQRSLHREFGGDIIFQQVGAEAVGAYLPFLEQRQKAGDFKLLDKDVSRRFWAHVRRAPGIRMPQDALETPWWLMTPKP
ncbi:hypothetical protein MYSTI_05968 [Myxococcus stipitatus DSM 14675]|uniref:PpiC domain-containing protein n=1 Tax=Myxococcus stipitatus (strain DSM 14675 / JCM 12634 / Mx s8) TaxID=1278073 RepID=L7UE96_MYXSD|nr:hypothetical protein [Myxococcus stipitatus]AGC47241.1 hypothetical protein MYSTI_05968 [Myxococcus stipitatus DSM 14675]